MGLLEVFIIAGVAGLLLVVWIIRELLRNRTDYDNQTKQFKRILEQGEPK